MVAPKADTSEVEDLSEEQIEQLLQQAEARLKAETSVIVLQQKDETVARLPRLDTSALTKPYVDTHGVIARADPGRLVDEGVRKLADGIRTVEDPVVTKRKLLEEKKATAGSDWFNMPRTNLTPELKRDLQLLKMRNVLDPHRHYKKDNGKFKVPQFSQSGTLIEGATEYYSARLKNADRKKTLVEEVLAGERETGRFKNKYNDIQVAKTSGKKGHYKAAMAKKYGKKLRT